MSSIWLKVHDIQGVLSQARLRLLFHISSSILYAKFFVRPPSIVFLVVEVVFQFCNYFNAHGFSCHRESHWNENMEEVIVVNKAVNIEEVSSQRWFYSHYNSSLHISQSRFMSFILLDDFFDRSFCWFYLFPKTQFFLWQFLCHLLLLPLELQAYGFSSLVAYPLFIDYV